MKDRFSIQQTNMFFAFFMVTYIVLSLVVGTFLPADTPMWLSMILGDLVILAPVAVLLIIKKLNPLCFLGLARIGAGDIFKTCLAAYSLLPLIYLINFVTMFFAENHVNDLVSDLYNYPLPVQMILIALLPALVEELIFRGLFYGSYRRKNKLIAAMMSGLFFGVAHMNINQFAYAMVIGVAFCILYEAGGNFFIPVTAHFAINANTVMIMALADTAPADLETTEIQLQATGLISLVVCVLVAALLGLCFFVLLVRSIARKHGREGFTKDFRHDPGKQEEGQREPVLDWFSGTTVAVSLLYMILMEL